MAVVMEGTRAADRAESSASPTRASLCPRQAAQMSLPGHQDRSRHGSKVPGDPMWAHLWAEGWGGQTPHLAEGVSWEGAWVLPVEGVRSQPRLWGHRREAWPWTVWKACLAQVFSSFPMLCSSPCPQNWDTRSGQAF